MRQLHISKISPFVTFYIPLSFINCKHDCMNNQLDVDLMMTINRAIIIIIDRFYSNLFFDVFLQFVQQIDALQECVCITAGFMHL